MGPGDEALPSLPAGDWSASGERPICLQRQGKTFILILSRSHPVESESDTPSVFLFWSGFQMVLSFSG